MVMYVGICVYVNEHNSLQTVHSIELKFGMYAAGHRRTNLIDLVNIGYIVFTGVQKKNSCTLRHIESNSLK